MYSLYGCVYFSDSVFVEEVEEYKGAETIQHLVKFVNSVCSLALQIDKDHALLMLHVQDFYHVVGIVHSVTIMCHF